MASPQYPWFIGIAFFLCLYYDIVFVHTTYLFGGVSSLFYPFTKPTLFPSFSLFLSLKDLSELRHELLRKDMLVQKHLSKLHHWQQVLEDVSVQHRKPTDLPPPGPLAFLEQASASLPPAPLKPN